MQTFLPYPDFEATAKCLDHKRLGKQRVEAFQILTVVTAKDPNRFPSRCHHPAVLMWMGYKNFLCQYILAICSQWKSQWFKDNVAPRARHHFALSPRELEQGHPHIPFWFGREDFHASHRSNLLRKDPEHYGQFGWTEPDNLPYVWPVRIKR